MCGIVGSFHPISEAAAPDVVARMRDRMAHRGPDGCGLWSSRDKHCVLGHRRLSIIDLSPAGHQPMSSADDRYRIVFNGEIYNYRELRSELGAGRVDSVGASIA